MRVLLIATNFSKNNHKHNEKRLNRLEISNLNKWSALSTLFSDKIEEYEMNNR